MCWLMRSPRFWLVVQMVAVLAALYTAGAMQLRWATDSESYVRAAQIALVEALAGPRTLGYPLLLRLIRPISPEFGVMPMVQVAAHFLAVLLFDLALRRYGASPWQAMVAASGLLYTLLYSPTTLSLASFLLTDSLGKSAAAVAVAFLFWVSARPREALPWIGLTLALAYAYHVRPAYLFLVPLVPGLGWFLMRIHRSWTNQPMCWVRLPLGLAAAAVLPLAVFCLLRLVLVGQFGLVAFGGHNLIGVTAELIDEATIREVPETWASLGRDIARRRQQLGLRSAIESGRLDVNLVTVNYTRNVNHAGVPAAQSLWRDDPITVDRNLSGLSLALIRARPRLYAWFVVYNLRDGIARLLGGGLVLQSMIVGFLLFAVRLAWRPSRAGSADNTAAGYLVLGRLSSAIVLVGVSFAIASTALVSLVEVHDGRYVDAAGLFLVPAAALVIYGQWAGLRAPGLSDSAKSCPGESPMNERRTVTV